MKLDILAIAAHPDDVELGAGGTVIQSVRQGKKVGILDLTRGELGTRGTVEIRAAEAADAMKILGCTIRDNVGLPDGFLANTREFQMAILPFLRKYRPEVVLANAISDRHPDHGRAAKLISDACFLSSLKAIETKDGEGRAQEHWRPKFIYHFVQDHYIKPDFVFDVTEVWEDKMDAIRAYKSQFYAGAKGEIPNTPISTPEFVDFLEGRAREYGRSIGVALGEGFTVDRFIGVNDLWDLK